MSRFKLNPSSRQRDTFIHAEQSQLGVGPGAFPRRVHIKPDAVVVNDQVQLLRLQQELNAQGLCFCMAHDGGNLAEYRVAFDKEPRSQQFTQVMNRAFRLLDRAAFDRQDEVALRTPANLDPPPPVNHAVAAVAADGSSRNLAALVR